MKQLAFDFPVETQPVFENFVVGRNAELVHRLRELAAGRGAERFIYVWGARGSGRTHLLRAAIDTWRRGGVRAAYVACTPGAPFPELNEVDAVAVDDVQCLTGGAELALFNLYNALRERGCALLGAGDVAPAQLGLRSDVATRLAWGLVYEVHGLSDAEKAHALAEHAAAHGFSLQPDVSRYLLTHARRDMPALVAAVDALDRYSRESKRAVTVPLLREVLAFERKAPVPTAADNHERPK